MKSNLLEVALNIIDKRNCEVKAERTDDDSVLAPISHGTRA